MVPGANGIIMNQSIYLAEFYKAYAEWLDNGAYNYSRNPHHFRRYWGLCSNLSKFLGDRRIAGQTTIDEMKDQFNSSGLDPTYPFDDSYEDYHDNRDMPLNGRRVQWVRDHAV